MTYPPPRNWHTTSHRSILLQETVHTFSWTTNVKTVSERHAGGGVARFRMPQTPIFKRRLHHDPWSYEKKVVYINWSLEWDLSNGAKIRIIESRSSPVTRDSVKTLKIDDFSSISKLWPTAGEKKSELEMSDDKKVLISNKLLPQTFQMRVKSRRLDQYQALWHEALWNLAGHPPSCMSLRNRLHVFGPWIEFVLFRFPYRSNCCIFRTLSAHERDRCLTIGGRPINSIMELRSSKSDTHNVYKTSK